MTKDEALKRALEAWQTSVYGSESHHKAMLLAMTNMAQARALDKKAENARELGLDYEPVQEPLEYWNAVEGWVKIDEVREHFESVGCGTIYKTAGDGRVPLTAAQRQPVDLTNDEINNIANGCHLGKSVQSAIREALDKYKEKNT
jgi:hypothetical protein